MDGRRRRRRRVPADRRPGQSVRHHAGAGQGRAAWRASTIIEDSRVTGIDVDDGRVTRREHRPAAASPAKGRRAAPASGRAQLGAHGRRQRAAGVACSTSTSSPSRSPGVPRDLPTLRDPDRLTYYKEEVGGLVMGGYEPNPIPWAIDGIPDDFHFQLLDADWDHFEPIDGAGARARAGARRTPGSSS